MFLILRKKLNVLCLIRLESSKKERLERDVIQMDTENLGSEDERDPIIVNEKKLKIICLIIVERGESYESKESKVCCL